MSRWFRFSGTFPITHDAESGRCEALIDTTNGCNLRCVFCSRSNSHLAVMTVKDLDLILSGIRPYVNSVQLSCAWEYSIAANAADIVRTLGKHKFPRTTIYTNANLLSDALAKALIEARIDFFVISIGEAKKETYERLRRGGRFESVLGNIKELDRMKQAAKTRHPRLCANLTLVRSNIEELPDFVDLAHTMGIEEIRGRHLILISGLDMSNERITDRDTANALIRDAQERAEAQGMVFNILEYGQEERPKECRAPWNQIYVSSNGDVSVCPRIHRYARLGNLMKETLEDVLGGREMQDLQKQFAAQQFNNPVCAICQANRECKIPIDQGF